MKHEQDHRLDLSHLCHPGIRGNHAGAFNMKGHDYFLDHIVQTALALAIALVWLVVIFWIFGRW